MRLILKIENQDSLSNGHPLVQTLDRNGIQLGRASYVEWQLPDPQKLISSEHAEIDFRDGAYILKDKSTNGTYLNGLRIDSVNREARLKDGDRLAIGHYELSVRTEGDTSQAAPIERQGNDDEEAWDEDDWGDGPPPIADDPKARSGTAQDPGMWERPFEPPSVQPTDDWGDFAADPNIAPSEPEPVARPTTISKPRSSERASAPPTTGDAAGAIAAFLRGAELPTDPQLLRNGVAIEQAGQTLRALVAGLFDLLKRQSEMKSMLRLERTMIQLADNNTFKFAASPDEALQRLMMPRESDLAGPAATEKSFNDVRLHEERLLTAMNDAVHRIVERLSPLDIKRRETGGIMDMLIPNARKAAWWDELERQHTLLMSDDGAKLDELIEDELRNAFTRHL